MKKFIMQGSHVSITCQKHEKGDHMKRDSGFRKIWAVISSLFICMMMVQGVLAADLTVRVQPSGDSFAKAYAITGEARTYFGNVEGGIGPYEYKWEFSNGGDTGFASVGSPRYINYTGKVFDAAGTQWARLTVRDSSTPQQTATATINLQVVSAADDNLIRQKNSAIDRGLRYMYQQESSSCSTSGGVNNFYNTGPDQAYIYGSVNQATAQIQQAYYFGGSVCPGTFTVNWGDGATETFTGQNYYCNYPYPYLENVSHTYATGGTYTISVSHDGITTGPFITVVVTAAGSGGTEASCWPGSGAYVGSTGMALIAFENHGHNLQSPDSDIYKKPVERGIQYLLDQASTQAISAQTYIGDPEVNDGDTDTDGIGVRFGDDNLYTASIAVLALVNSCDESYAKSHLAATTSPVNGMTLWDIAVDAKDWFAWAQTDNTSGGGEGGWRYSSNYYDSDNSVTQWPVLALSEAKNRWNINVNPLVVTELNKWLAFSQCSNGAFGYASGDSSGWCNFPKTAAGSIMLNYAGKIHSDAAVSNAESWLNSNWGSENYGYMYSMYGFYKAMKIWKITDFFGRNWEELYDQWLIDNQSANNTWGDYAGWEDAYFATYSAIAILAPEVASLPPVANAGGPYADVNAGQNVALNGSGSYHQDPARSLVKWEWDFNAVDGLWWDTKAAPAAGEGAVGMNVNTSYPDAGMDKIYTVTLRVTDNTAPTPMTDTDTETVNVTSGNVAPVAVTNGPWSALPGQAITFDGSGSYDPNAGAPLNDYIALYEWDLDGDGLFNETNGHDGTPVVAGDYSKVTKTFATPVSLPATLRVTDSFGKVGTSTATANIISIAIAYAQKYTTCYRVTLNRFQERQGLRVTFKNQGNSTADNVKMILTSLPANLTISNNRSFTQLGMLDAGQEKTSACDATAKTAEIEVIFDRRIVPTGLWLWRGEFDFSGNHYVVDNIPALGP